jgi:hypothetical protein
VSIIIYIMTILIYTILISDEDRQEVSRISNRVENGVKLVHSIGRYKLIGAKAVK